MAAKQDVSLLFGVLGDGSVSGQSGTLIRKQINKIIGELNGNQYINERKIRITIDTDHMKKTLNKSLEKTFNSAAKAGKFKLSAGKNVAAIAEIRTPNLKTVERQMISLQVKAADLKKTIAGFGDEGIKMAGFSQVEAEVADIENVLKGFYKSKQEMDKTEIANIDRRISKMAELIREYERADKASTSRSDTAGAYRFTADHIVGDTTTVATEEQVGIYKMMSSVYDELMVKLADFERVGTEAPKTFAKEVTSLLDRLRELRKELDQQAVSADKAFTSASKIQAANKDKADGYSFDAKVAAGELLNNSDLKNAEEAQRIYADLSTVLELFGDRSTEWSTTQTKWIKEQINQLRTLRTESEQYAKSLDKTASANASWANSQQLDIDEILSSMSKVSSSVTTESSKAAAVSVRDISNKLKVELENISKQATGVTEEQKRNIKGLKSELEDAVEVFNKTATPAATPRTNIEFSSKSLDDVTLKAERCRVRLQQIGNVDLRNAAIAEFDSMVEDLESDLTTLGTRSEQYSYIEGERFKQRIKDMDEVVSRYERMDEIQRQAQNGNRSYVNAQGSKADSLIVDGWSDKTSSQYNKAREIYDTIIRTLDEYLNKKEKIDSFDKQAIANHLADLRKLRSEANKAYKEAPKIDANNEKIVANMKLELSRFNEYLMTVSPKALTEFASQIDNIRNVLGAGLPTDMSKATNAIKNLKAQIKQAGYESGNVITFVINKIKSFGVYLLSSKLTTGVSSMFSNIIENVKTLDEALTDLRIVTGDTERDTKKLLESYSKMAQTLGTTTSNVSSAAIEWQRQGYSDSETNQLVEDSMVLSVVGMVESADAAQYLTSAIKGYKTEVEDAIGIVDMLTAVDVEAAVSAGGLAEAMARTANSARLAGVDMSNLIGYIAAVGEVTQRDMTTVGEAFKTVFARYSNVKLGKLTDGETGESLNDFETSLRAIGISLRDAKGDFRNFNDVILEVGDAWDSLTTIQQSAIATTLGGVRQRENILVLFENLDKAMKYAEIAANSSGTAMEKFGVYQESLEAKTESLTAAFEEFSMKLLDSGLIKWFIDIGTFVINAASAFDAIPAKLAAISSVVLIAKSSFDSFKNTGLGISLFKNAKSFKDTITDLG